MLKNERQGRHRKIKAAMALRSVTCKQVADEVGCTPSHVALVTSGRRWSQRVVDALVKHGIPRHFFVNDEAEGNGESLPGSGNQGSHGLIEGNDTQKAEGF